MKKLVAFVLVLALCLSLCSVALAANVTSVAVTFDTAKAKDGDTLTQLQSYVSCVGENVELQSVDAISHNQSSPGPIASDGTISSSTEYHVRLVFKTTDSSKFGNGTTVTFNSSSIDRTDSNIPGYTIANEHSGPEQDFDIVTDGEGDYLIINTGAFTPVEELNKPEPSINCEELAKGAAIAAGITVVTVGTIHTVKAIKNYKAEKAAAAEAAKLAEMPMVAIGDSGDAVTTLQTELNAQGYDCGEVDGVFGQNTLNAVIAFQTANGLAADGIVGVQTWGALL